MGSPRQRVAAGCGAAVATLAAGYYLSYHATRRRGDVDVDPARLPLDGALRPDRSLPCALAEKVPLSGDAARFRFLLPTPKHRLGVPPEPHRNALYHVSVHDDASVERAYTPTSPPGARGYFDLVVKEYPDGDFSRAIHALRPGETMPFRGPIVTMPYEPNAVREIGMIAGGTGIAPMYQLIRKVLRSESEDEGGGGVADRTRLALLYANRSPRDVLLKDELDALAGEHPDQFRVCYVLEEDDRREGVDGVSTTAKEVAADVTSKNKRWFSRFRRSAEANSTIEKKSTNHIGRVNDALIRDLLPSPTDDDFAILVCGPPGMLDALCGPAGRGPSSGTEQPRRLRGILGDMGYGHQVFAFADAGVQNFSRR